MSFFQLKFSKTTPAIIGYQLLQKFVIFCALNYTSLKLFLDKDVGRNHYGWVCTKLTYYTFFFSLLCMIVWVFKNWLPYCKLNRTYQISKQNYRTRKCLILCPVLILFSPTGIVPKDQMAVFIEVIFFAEQFSL